MKSGLAALYYYPSCTTMEPSRMPQINPELEIIA